MNQSARILVADDDPDILDGTARLLERAGYVVDRASSGEEALQVVQNHHPDLLLLDHDMPGIDGIEVCRRIKRDPTMVDSLVVIVSASHTDSDEQASGLESGADGYIGRPIANRELLARVRAFVRIQNLTFSMREQTRQLEERNENLRQERLAALNLMEDAAEARERTEKANQALRESEETLRTHIENSFDVIFTLNKEGKFLFVSPAWERHFGYPTSDVIGKSFAPCVHPDDIAPLAKYLERVLSSGKGETSPSYRVKHADGSWRWIVCNGTPYVDTKGELRFIGVGRDITDAKRAEEVLRESEVRYKALFTGTAEGIVVADLETKQFRYANPSMCRMFGYTEEEFVRLGVAGIHPKESLCYVQAEFAAQARGEKTFTKDLPCLRKDGVTFYANVNAALIVLDDRKCLVGFFTDTTENKKAEEALRESEELLSEMTTQVPGVVYQFYARPNGEMGFYYVSDRSERVLGLKPDLKEYLERFVALVIPEHREGFVTSIKKSVNESTEWKYEGMLQKPTGENICFFGNSNPSPRENEMVFNGIVLDITERKRMERTLADNEEKIHLLLDSTAEAIYGLDMSGNCTFCNSSCLHLLGYKHPDELLGKNMHWLIHSKRPDGTPFPAEGCRIFKAFKKGEGTHVDDEVLWRSDGTSFPAEYWSYPQRHDGVVIGAVVTFLNITERKRSEEALKETQEQLFQTSKLASLGQLSAGAAHEINNPLAGIVGFTEAMLLDLKTKEIAPNKIAHDLGIVLKNAERCKVIISNLLNFARAKDLQTQESDINSLLDDALALVEYKTAAQKIKVVKRYQDNPRKVNIDANQMTQVFINVLSNAQNAMPHGGELLVRTWWENNFAMIEFKDTGIGIEEENLIKVFDPFFTTREPGQGVGLGLSISYSIMKRHEGSIEAKSDGKNKGASFIIKIPV